MCDQDRRLPRLLGQQPHGQIDGIPTGSYTALAAGNDRMCAIKTDGTLDCWGNNNSGEHDGIPAGSFGDPNPPVVEPLITGTQGSGGWYTGDVTVT